MDARIPASPAGKRKIRVLLAALLMLALAGVLMPSHRALAFETINRIKASGELRIGQLAPASATAEQERVLALNLSGRLNARAYFIDYVGVDSLLKALADGDIDVAIEPLSQARPLPSGLTHTLPVRHADLWRVTSPYVTDSGSKSAPLTVHFASDAWHQALLLKKTNKDLRLSVAPVRASRFDLLSQVARGELPASLAYAFEFTDTEIAGLKPRQRLRDQVALSWAVRSADRVLLKKVDDFLRERSLTRAALYVDHSDWPQIKQRGRLRLVTLYRPETYFAWSGHFIGFDYDLARAFARSHGIGLEMVIARDQQEMIERLERGEADMAAALLPSSIVTETTVASIPYLNSGGRVVSLKGRFHRLGPLDFHQKRVLVGTASPYPAHFEQLTNAGISAQVETQAVNAEELVDAVIRGEADFAVVDDHQFQLQSLWRNDIVSLMELDQTTSRVWTMRNDTPQLTNVVNEFLASKASQRRVRIGRNKYFSGTAASDNLRSAVAVFQRDHRFSPFDELAQRYANYYAFDWRLILAIMLQESRFDPNAVSRSGAKGLMQLQTAASQQMGISDLFDPQSSVHGGVKYLDWVRSQLEEDLDIRDRTWFSLAAYNGGLAHVIAARKLAVQRGYDPRRWFGHVELAMAELPKQARYKDLDARQVTDYVSRIRDYFEMYVRLTEHEQTPGSRRAMFAPVAAVAVD